MSTYSVLNNENWSDYDDRKKRSGSDARNFACTESWEVEYLAEKIHKQHTGTSKDQIRVAIKACCTELSAPHPRQAFVECIMRRLGLHS